MKHIRTAKMSNWFNSDNENLFEIELFSFCLRFTPIKSKKVRFYSKEKKLMVRWIIGLRPPHLFIKRYNRATYICNDFCIVN